MLRKGALCMWINVDNYVDGVKLSTIYSINAFIIL